MDTLNVHNVPKLAYLPQHLPLPEVPAPAFNAINDLLNLCPDLEMLISWTKTVHHHKQTATRPLLPGDLTALMSRHSRSNETSSLTAGDTLKGRYICYKCHKRVGTSKEFHRHMIEKCELLRLHHCPDCAKTYRRPYHLRYHHERSHGCSQVRCTHLIDAAQAVAPKSVLGCGYCIQWFDKAKDFINHLVKHLEAPGIEPRWSDTMHIQSLLQHPGLRTTWNSLCATRFNGPACYWPPLIWNINDVEAEVHDLQYGVSGQDLSLCLAKLLEKGLGFEYFDHTQGLLTTRVNQPSDKFQDVSLSHDFWKDPTLSLMTGLDTYMTNDLPSGSVDSADLANTTPSTLVNTEDFWTAKTSLSGNADGQDGMSVIISDLKESLPTFDAPLDYTSGLMDLVSWEGNTCNDTFYTNPPQYDSPTPISPLQTQFDKVEQTVMNSIPGVYPDAGPITEYHTTTVNGSVNPLDTLFPPSLGDQCIGSLSSGPLPPFHPTPPLQGRKSHKRSISGRFLRLIQNMPNIPPTY